MSELLENIFVEVCIEVDSICREHLIGELMAMGCTGVQIRDDEVSDMPRGRSQVITWHQSAPNLVQEIKALCERVGERTQLRLAPVVQPSWPSSLNGEKPIKVGDTLAICQPHHPPEKDRYNIVIAPGLGFGHGTHPTTLLSLKLLERALSARGIKRLLDLGTGTGVLALSAANWGAAQIWAVDPDSSALAAARRNATESGVANKITFSEREPPSHMRFDGCVANLYLGALTSAAPLLARVCKPGSFCIVSGFTEDRQSNVRAAFLAQGFVQANEAIAKPWMAVEWRKSNRS